jgi:hypothetical protein
MSRDVSAHLVTIKGHAAKVCLIWQQFILATLFKHLVTKCCSHNGVKANSDRNEMVVRNFIFYFSVHIIVILNEKLCVYK